MNLCCWTSSWLMIMSMPLCFPCRREEEDAAEEEQEAIVFRIDDSDGEQSLTVVEDDEEWEAATQPGEEMAVREFDEWDDEE